jgi:hypothetical protein
MMVTVSKAFTHVVNRRPRLALEPDLDGERPAELGAHNAGDNAVEADFTLGERRQVYNPVFAAFVLQLHRTTEVDNGRQVFRWPQRRIVRTFGRIAVYPYSRATHLLDQGTAPLPDAHRPADIDRERLVRVFGLVSTWNFS